MGILIGCEKIGHEWPGKRVLAGQSLSVFEGDRIGIVGTNGDGKSTLLEIMAGELEPDQGTVTYRRAVAVGLLGQADALDDDATLKEAIVGGAPDYVWAANPRTREIIDELVSDLDWTGKVGELSGGQRRRADLARLLVGDYDVLCLDEPTNHLDLHAIRWLANHLKARWPEGQGALLVVTHDRWFLDEVATSMWEVHDGRVDPFEGGYSAYIQQRVERDRQAQVAEERRQNMLRKELNWLAHGAKARTSKPKFRIDAAMALVENDPPLRNPVELHRMAVTRLGKQVIEMKRVSFSYEGDGGTNKVIDDVTWIIGPGDRIGILGENGAGKTTLLKVMCEQLEPTSGTVKVGKTVRFGMLGQRLEWLSNFDDWRLTELLNNRFKRNYVVEGKSYSATQLAERLGFDRKELMTYIRDLSGGQRRRLAILCVLMEEPNVLVLDEPGNDLDTDMLAVVEDLLDSWPGTLIMVSHDRFLMERVTDDQFALIDGRITHCPGGVDEYLDLLDEREGVQAPEAAKVAKEPQRQASGLTNQERRELKRRFDAVSRRIEKVESEPARLEAELKRLDPTDFEALVAKQKEIDEAKELVEELETEWLELADTLGIE